MNDDKETIGLLKAQNAALTTISNQLAALIQIQAAGSAPNYRRQLADFTDFDWSEIGATVSQSDRGGPATVDWNGLSFTRRSGSGKFGDAIWFSRGIGRDGDKNLFARLITFKDADQAEPLVVQPPRGGQRQAQPAPAQAAAQPRQAAASPPKAAAPPPEGWWEDEEGALPAGLDDRDLWNKIVEVSLTVGKFNHQVVNEILKSQAEWRDKALALTQQLGISQADLQTA